MLWIALLAGCLAIGAIVFAISIACALWMARKFPVLTGWGVFLMVAVPTPMVCWTIVPWIADWFVGRLDVSVVFPTFIVLLVLFLATPVISIAAGALAVWIDGRKPPEAY